MLTSRTAKPTDFRMAKLETNPIVPDAHIGVAVGQE